MKVYELRKEQRQVLSLVYLHVYVICLYEYHKQDVQAHETPREDEDSILPPDLFIHPGCPLMEELAPS